MPVCTLHLVHLAAELGHFLALVDSLPQKPLVVSRVVRWIIRPSSIDVSPLLDHPWDLLLILPGTAGLPASLVRPDVVRHVFEMQVGIPAKLVDGFAAANAQLLHPSPGKVPALTGALDRPRVADSAQGLELSPVLREWIPKWAGSAAGKGAVSMLNLLAFKPGMHEEYLKYGKAFAESIGSRRGGTAKLVAKAVQPKQWDEMALAHYPSIWHFADMIASDDYQQVNHAHRLPSIKDTCILMTSELDLPQWQSKAKL